ncbi:unnamed protein product [Closterium sp. NIES-65]|nr:unnamed protein product [Closterium sp. NIES-65]
MSLVHGDDRLDMEFETGERLIRPGGQESGERAGGKFAPGLDKREEGQSETPKKPLGIRASAEPEPSQTSDSSSTSAVKEPAAGKAAAGKPAAGKGFGKAPQQPAVVRRPAPSQPLLSTRPVGEEEKKAAEIETAVVASLGFVFLLIILEGLFLAAAGACNAGDLCVGGVVGGGGRWGWEGEGKRKGRGRGGCLWGWRGWSGGLIWRPIETAVVASLGFVFLLIVLERLFLAAAGECSAGKWEGETWTSGRRRGGKEQEGEGVWGGIEGVAGLPIGGAGSHGNRPGVSRLLSIPSHRPKPLPTRFTPPCPCAGFLSEELDQLAMDLVYPAFSPTVAVFLLGATAYGAFKVIGIGGKKQ